MKIIENTTLLAEFITKLENKYSSVIRTNIHVSDLLYCMRKSYYQRVNPKPLTEKEMGYFLDGANRHRAIQGLSNMEYEKKVKKYGVVGSIDLFNKIPIEYKSTRMSNGISDTYIKQLGYYCTLLNKKKGILIIQRLLVKDKSPFEVYNIKYDKEDIDTYKKEIKYKSKIFATTLKNNNVSILDKPISKDIWLCDNCSYKSECETKWAKYQIY